MGKRDGKYESNKPPKIRSNTGRFMQNNTRNVQKEVEEARRVLDDEEKKYEVLVKASNEILKGTITRPINKRLQKIQDAYEAKKEELFGEIIAKSKKIDSSIMNAIEKEMQGFNKFEHRLEAKFKSEDLDDSMSFRNIRMYGKTFRGYISARMAKTPYTLVARYHALRGNKEKQDEFLFKATKASRKVIEKLRTDNRKFAKETEARTDKFNEVDDYTTHYREREAKYNKSKKDTEEYLKANSKEDGLKKKVTLRLADIGQKRIFVAAYVAASIEDAGNYIARKSAIMGGFKIADFAAKQTVKASDYLMDRAARKNLESYAKTDAIVQGIEDAKKATIHGKKEIAIKEFTSTLVANRWAKIRGNSLKARGIKLANNAVTSTTRFFANSDMKISEFYARSLANLGLTEKSKEVMDNAGKRTLKSMDDAEEINKYVRDNFGFSIKRRRTVDSSRGFMEMIKKGISTGQLKQPKGELSTWMEDIEKRRAAQKVKRRYTSNGKKTNILERLERNSKNILTRVQTSLNTNRTARAAAQADLDMNPEKNKEKRTIRKSSSRDDRE